MQRGKYRNKERIGEMAGTRIWKGWGEARKREELQLAKAIDRPQ